MSQRIIWITGASSGIGLAIAREFATHGWRVGLGARRQEALDQARSSLAAGGGHAAVALDVRDASSVSAWAHALRERIGAPDVLVNAAGWGSFQLVQETTEEDFDRTIDTNLRGLFLVTREVLPGMIARGEGHIVNILSVAARVPFPRNAAYNASKYGALGFTEALRAEARKEGVRVTAVLPGATDTPFWDTVPGEWDRARMMPPAVVARSVREAVESGPSALVEEIRIAPPWGNL